MLRNDSSGGHEAGRSAGYGVISEPSNSWRFNGGLRLPGHKSESNGAPVETPALPSRLILPLQQHIGRRAKPRVREGQRVLKGQPIAEADGYISAYLHAPTSGRVAAVDRFLVPHPSGLAARCIVIDTDGQDEWFGNLDSPCPAYIELAPEELRRRVRRAGIVGLGGAAFPSAAKLNPGPERTLDWLVLNGAECEPYISCDDTLMRSRAKAVVLGAEIICRALGIARAIIGVEEDMPEAIASLRSVLETAATSVNISVQSVPTIYPTGGEKQLLKVLTGMEVPSEGIPADVGLVCQNVGTAAAVYEAVVNSRPLISRIVTVTGAGVQRPCNVEALLGTPVSHLVAHCGGYTADVNRLILGGPMMGFAISSDEVPVVKGTNCVLAATADEVQSARPALPCIRCGACAAACPVNLLPQQLYWYARAKDFDKIQDYELFDCIECGCCASVCPSHISLVEFYRYAKTEIWSQEQERLKSDIARERHESRLERLETEKRAREERLSRKKKALNKGEDRKAAIEAALRRVQEKKAQAAHEPTDPSCGGSD